MALSIVPAADIDADSPEGVLRVGICLRGQGHDQDQLDSLWDLDRLMRYMSSDFEINTYDEDDYPILDTDCTITNISYIIAIPAIMYVRKR